MFSKLVLINYNIMLNNYTDSADLYHCCDVILPATPATGELLVGDFNSATDADLLKAHNIQTIITASAGMEHLQVPVNVLHITFALLDAKTENIRQFFQDSYTVIKANLPKGGILVHCAAGISRSATLVIAYLIKSRKIGFRQAIAIVKARRKNVCPNLGFERQLKQYEKEILEGSSHARINLKKTVSQKISEERKTSYHNGNKNNVQDHFMYEPRTADYSVRKKIEMIKKMPISHSQNRPRDRRNFKVRAINKEFLFVSGQGQSGKERESLHNSQKISPPIIQTHMRNGYPGIGKHVMNRNY